MALIKVELERLGPRRYSMRRIGVDAQVAQVAADTVPIVYGIDFLLMKTTYPPLCIE